MALSLGSTAITLAGDSSASADQHCVVILEEVSPGSAETRVAEKKCFDTTAEAIRYGSGRDDIPDGITPSELTDEMVAPGAGRSAQSSYLLSIEYEHKGFNGDTHYFYASASCVGHNWQNPNLATIGWAEKISASEGYSDCNKVKHWENTYYDGAVKTCYGSCSYIGDAMNDRTSSLQWRN